jgi:hypothetical protein
VQNSAIDKCLAATLDVKRVPEHGVFSVSSGNGHVNTVRLFQLSHVHVLPLSFVVILWLPGPALF